MDEIWKEISKDDVVITKHLEGSEEYQFLAAHPHAKTIGYLKFQKGNPANGINGVSFESLLEVIAERLGRFQETEFACAENAAALEKIIEARDILYSRIQRRKEQGIHGTQEGEGLVETPPDEKES